MKSSIYLIFVLIALALGFVEAREIKCPPKTTANYRSIIFVGKSGLGGDKYVKVWFEYGEQKNILDRKTKALTLFNDGIFCVKVNNLKPCKTYYYRASAQNSAGVNYGETKAIKTLCRQNKSGILNSPSFSKWIVF